MNISQANKNDIPALVVLLNSAYRGDASKKGWTTEANLLEGELRTDESTLHELFDQPDAIFLKYTDENNQITGSVFLHKKEDKLYLGMLSVSPLLQAKGIGKQLLAASEQYARQQKCKAIFMTVISLRHELINWYERYGYKNTGRTAPFPTDNRFGKPVHPLEFVILEKEID